MTQPTDRPGINHLTSDMLDQLCDRLERAEATLTAVRDELAAIDRDRARLDDDCDAFGGGCADAAARIRAVLDQHGQTPA